MVIGGCRGTFSFVEQEAELRKMHGYEKRWKESCCRHSLPPECTFLFEIFFFLRSIGDVRSSTFDHSAQQYPVFQFLYRGFSHINGWTSRYSTGQPRPKVDKLGCGLIANFFWDKLTSDSDSRNVLRQKS